MVFIGYFISLIIGLILGLIGGGGAILTIPLLKYFFSVPIEEATSYSLFIIGVSALVGTLMRFKYIPSYLKQAIIFVIPSAITASLIRLFILPYIPDQWSIGTIAFHKGTTLTIVFIFLMIYIGISMLRKPKVIEVHEQSSWIKIVLYAILTGMLSGFMGAGGGFIIVPLLMKMGMEMKKAIGTSLVIVTLQSLVAFGADILHQYSTNHFFIRLDLLLYLTALTILGTLVGSYLQRYIPTKWLKIIFAILLILVAAGISIDVIF